MQRETVRIKSDNGEIRNNPSLRLQATLLKNIMKKDHKKASPKHMNKTHATRVN